MGDEQSLGHELFGAQKSNAFLESTLYLALITWGGIYQDTPPLAPRGQPPGGGGTPPIFVQTGAFLTHTRKTLKYTSAPRPPGDNLRNKSMLSYYSPPHTFYFWMPPPEINIYNLLKIVTVPASG